MKKISVIALAALVLSLSLAGCGQKGSNKTDNNTTAKTEQTDASGAYEGTGENGGAVVEDYSPEQVDMGKIEGEKLSSDSDKKEYSGKLGDVEVTIADAKVIDYNGEKVAIVSFDYKNNSDTDMPFTGSLRAQAYQGDNRLSQTVVTGVEGVTMLSLSESIGKGEEITVQTAYRLRDTDTPLVVEVSEFFTEQATSDGLTKTFEF